MGRSASPSRPSMQFAHGFKHQKSTGLLLYTGKHWAFRITRIALFLQSDNVGGLYFNISQASLCRWLLIPTFAFLVGGDLVLAWFFLRL